ncbi:MAG: hypothetical protein L0H53_03090 [Candidatus Nitrosocosmicus sp.]|nr:hypothetical protein [Candidatus Nitrosocosmicus sp.]MDN5867820.1 hypothetical protein [Candidatus Nitrosocosmicus sp.]
MVETRCDSNYGTSLRIGEAVRHNLNSSSTSGYQTIPNNCDSCSCCDADPIETTKKLLESSFFTALKEIHVDKIKKIIEREWGSTIDRTAELAVKPIEKQWQTSVSSSITSKEFYEELGKIMTCNGKQ